MKRMLYIVLLLQVSAFSSSHAIFVEGHGQCKTHSSRIDQLNVQDYGLFSYSVVDDYSRDESLTPICRFVKESIGNISVRTTINEASTFVEVENQIKMFEEEFFNGFKPFEEYCSFSRSSYSLSHQPDASGNYTLNFNGSVRCSSVKGIEFVENSDVLNLLKKVGLGSGYTVEMSRAPEPVISGTTIHN